jgi:hypothetical protein
MDGWHIAGLLPLNIARFDFSHSLTRYFSLLKVFHLTCDKFNLSSQINI